MSHNWAWDLNKDDSLAGNERIDFTIVSAKYLFPLWKTAYASVGGNMSHTGDLPAPWDSTVYAVTAGVGGAYKGWNLNANVSHDISDENVNETIWTLGVGRSW